jgi:hypothetical protein
LTEATQKISAQSEQLSPLGVKGSLFFVIKNLILPNRRNLFKSDQSTLEEGEKLN